METAIVEAADLPLLATEIVEQPFSLLFAERIRIFIDRLHPFEIAERPCDLVAVASGVADHRFQRAEDDAVGPFLLPSVQDEGIPSAPRRSKYVAEYRRRQACPGRSAPKKGSPDVRVGR